MLHVQHCDCVWLSGQPKGLAAAAAMQFAYLYQSNDMPVYQPRFHLSARTVGSLGVCSIFTSTMKDVAMLH